MQDKAVNAYPVGVASTMASRDEHSSRIYEALDNALKDSLVRIPDWESCHAGLSPCCYPVGHSKTGCPGPHYAIFVHVEK